jgi:hypothetical protein
MDIVTRSVKDIDAADRQALEHVIGSHLSEHQQVMIQVRDAVSPAAENADSGMRKPGSPTLPEWCNVYEGLSDAEIADIEKSIVRHHDSRFSQ